MIRPRIVPELLCAPKNDDRTRIEHAKAAQARHEPDAAFIGRDSERNGLLTAIFETSCESTGWGESTCATGFRLRHGAPEASGQRELRVSQYPAVSLTSPRWNCLRVTVSSYDPLQPTTVVSRRTISPQSEKELIQGARGRWTENQIDDPDQPRHPYSEKTTRGDDRCLHSNPEGRGPGLVQPIIGFSFIGRWTSKLRPTPAAQRPAAPVPRIGIRGPTPRMRKCGLRDFPGARRHQLRFAHTSLLPAFLRPTPVHPS